ncbi:hypothetical protein BP5796_10423 [Coleophoma crateriformis]|uniref:Uncharacterized protein n=1 Tax=Coleophoma crateriformis TaxID=565419 RepID=A0A3D8QQC7_9HELO|nr:hypothetical protein BP5796_10423 [Coleophoma crateriformis]
MDRWVDSAPSEVASPSSSCTAKPHREPQKTFPIPASGILFFGASRKLSSMPCHAMTRQPTSSCKPTSPPLISTPLHPAPLVRALPHPSQNTTSQSSSGANSCYQRDEGFTAAVSMCIEAIQRNEVSRNWSKQTLSRRHRCPAAQQGGVRQERSHSPDSKVLRMLDLPRDALTNQAPTLEIRWRKKEKQNSAPTKQTTKWSEQEQQVGSNAGAGWL